MKEALIAAYHVQLQSLKAEKQAYEDVFGTAGRPSDRYLVLREQIRILEREYRDFWRDGTYAGWDPARWDPRHETFL